MTEFISVYGIWLVAAFIALESVGIPLPAEAALIAAAFFAAKTQGLNIWYLLAAGISAAVLGEIVGFWIGRKYGRLLLSRYGARLGFTEGRIRIGQWLFVQYGGRFVFIARFLPFLRNMAAVLAGTNAMAQHNFYFASATAAAAWIVCYGLSAYWFGETFATVASPATVMLGIAAASIVLALPAIILRYEKHLLAKAERGLPTAVVETPEARPARHWWSFDRRRSAEALRPSECRALPIGTPRSTLSHPANRRVTSRRASTPATRRR